MTPHQERDDERSEGQSAAVGASVVARNIRHVYENGFEAIKPTTLEVASATFCTLLGPSGSGKTTLLRILAGLLSPTSGQVLIGGRDVTRIPVQKRDIGFVFQHYALFPHMSAYQNIEYPLKIRGWDRGARRQRVEEVLDLIELRGFASSRPEHLSGGQQQRVAVGRALVYRPKVLLLDEPLGALDRKLRQQLGSDLRRIQQQTGTTAIYVTHDQEEAFILSDQVVVMNGGRVLQHDRPERVYAYPSSRFVAGFLGETNIVDGVVVATDERTTTLQSADCLIPCCTNGAVVRVGDVFACSVRPEDITLHASPPHPDGDTVVFGSGVVETTTFMGSRYRIVVTTNDRHFVIESNRGERVPDTGARVHVTWKASSGVLVEPQPGVSPSRV
jgi:putative spermidine/putrescine transport system ATP-binding protein